MISATVFVEALRVETADNNLFRRRKRRAFAMARSTTFNRGLTRHAEPCEERPDGPPIWRVGSQKIHLGTAARNHPLPKGGSALSSSCC